jgi:hypothetical protein
VGAVAGVGGEDLHTLEGGGLVRGWRRTGGDSGSILPLSCSFFSLQLSFSFFNQNKYPFFWGEGHFPRGFTAGRFGKEKHVGLEQPLEDIVENLLRDLQGPSRGRSWQEMVHNSKATGSTQAVHRQYTGSTQAVHRQFTGSTGIWNSQSVITALDCWRLSLILWRLI